jgi:hypothetical protein
LSDTSTDYGDWDLDDQYLATLQSFVAGSVAEQARFLDSLAFTVAVTWLLYGGIRESERRRYMAQIEPVLERAYADSARRGAAFTRTLHAFNTKSPLDLNLDTIDFDNDPDLVEVGERSRRFLDAPVIRARWLLSDPEDPPEDPDPPAPVKRAVEAAKQVATVTDVDGPAAALVDLPEVDAPEVDVADDEQVPDKFRRAVVNAAAHHAQLATEDAKTAYDVGAQAGAQGLGTTLQRWLKIPGPNACSWCFAVSARGYRTATSPPRHRYDKCGVRPVWAQARTIRKGELIVGTEDWQQALEDAGYGGLIRAWAQSREENAAAVRDIISRPEDFQPLIDAGLI